MSQESCKHCWFPSQLKCYNCDNNAVGCCKATYRSNGRREQHHWLCEECIPYRKRLRRKCKDFREDPRVCRLRCKHVKQY